MFGKKKTFPGVVAMYYEGLPGFDQNGVLYINHDDVGIKFIKPNSETTALLPYEKLLNFEVMPEPDYMLRYHNERVSTSKAKFEKWYIAVHYQSDNEQKTIGLWSVPGKSMNDIKAELQLALKPIQEKSYTL